MDHNDSEIIKAAIILGLPKRATMKMIKENYRKLLSQWHPDRCGQDPDKCAEMTRGIISAYEVLIAYCSKYKYSLRPEDQQKGSAGEDFWKERFGEDPIWGKSRVKKED